METNQQIKANFASNFLAAYISLMTDKLTGEDIKPSVINSYRKSMYTAVVEAIQENINPLPAIEENVEKWSKVKQLEEFKVLIDIKDSDIESEDSLKEEFKQFKAFVKECKTMLTFVDKWSDSMTDKTNAFVTKTLESSSTGK